MFEKIYPKRYIKWLEKNKDYLPISIQKFLDFQFLFSFSISFLILLFLKNFLYFLLSFLIFNLLFAFLVFNAKENAKKYIEFYLPDALSLISSNLKSGATFEKALLNSARQEFKYLDSILKRMGKEIASGKSVEDVLSEYAKKSDIESFKKSLYLLLEGFKKGSKISDLLFELSESLREQQVLKKEMIANTSLYLTFILIALLFAMPLMFALSYTFISFLSQTAPAIPEIKTFNIPIGFKGLKYDINFLKNIMLLQMIISSFFASLLFGIIKEGNEKAGLKYFLIFIPIVLLVFHFGITFSNNLFGIFK